MGRIFLPGSGSEKRESTLEERRRFREAAEEIDAQKRHALAQPGPSWHDWWYYRASKWYVVLFYFVVDGTCFSLLGMLLGYFSVPVVVAIVYGEFALYQYLYHRTNLDTRHRGETFRRTWYRPFDVGRWTPEGTARRAGALRGPREPGVPTDEGPKPEEFF